MDKNDGTTQINNLLLFMGSPVKNLLDICQKKKGDWNFYNKLIEVFDNYYIKNRNLIYENEKFNQRQQLEVEIAQEYIDSVTKEDDMLRNFGVKKLAKICKYGSLEELIRDGLVVGVTEEMRRELKKIYYGSSLFYSFSTSRRILYAVMADVKQ